MNCREVRDLLFPYLEGEVTPSERTAIQAHLSGCAICQGKLGALSEIQGRLRRSLQFSASQAAPSPQAWTHVKARLFDMHQVNQRNHSNGPNSGRRRWMMSLTQRMPRWLPASILVLVVAVAAFALVPPLRTLAQDPLGIFRVKRFATVTIDPSTLPVPKGADPTALGSLTISQAPSVTPVTSLQEAQSLVDFTLRSPKGIPSDLAGNAKIAVSREGRFSYTFDLQKLRAYLAGLGIAAGSLPGSLDGATLKLTIPTQVVIEYRTQNGAPSLMMGQGHSPVLEAPPGLNVEDLRRQVLSMPGLPPELAAQLQALADWQHTAVIPLPKDQALSKEVAVDGVTGLYIQGNSGSGNALLWQKGEVLYGMAGTLTADELVAAANSLYP